MTEMVLPGTYIEVRAERLVTATPVSVNPGGVVGTAGLGEGGHDSVAVQVGDRVPAYRDGVSTRSTSAVLSS